MAGHTYIDIGTSGKLKGRIYWESTSNGPVANTSTVYARVEAARTDAYGPTTGTWTGDVNINDNAKTFSKSKSINDSWVTLEEHTLTVTHNNDGTKTCFIGATVNGPSGTSLSGNTVTGFQYVPLDTIPRYTSITSFTVSKRNETSFTFNWQTADTIDYLWYSTNNGSSWTGIDVTDGTSGSFTVSGLSPNTTYNCKIRVRRKDSQLTTDSSQVSQTTYKAPTQALSSKTETSMVVSWSIDSTANHIWYSKDNGANWVDVGNVNATSGTYTISGLSANTAYNIKTRVRRSATNTTYDTSAMSQTTYNYPYCTSAPNFTIGNSVKLDFYNPLNRTMAIRMWSHVSQGFVTDTINVTGTTYTFTPNANILYASIPNNTSSTYNIDVTYSGNTNVKTGGAYSVNTSACIPTFTNFEYKDTVDNLLTQAIDNDQVIVQNVSNVNVVISSANKMVAQNSATASKYQATFSNLSKTINYSDNDIDAYVGIPTGSGSSTFKVTAYDSRSIPKEVSKTINIIPYSAPVINVNLTRVNNYETETKLKVSGTFARVTIDNVDKNAIEQVQYRYRESGGTWGSWTTMTIASQGSGNYQTAEVTLTCDNTKQFDFEFQVIDRAKTSTVSGTLNVGQALMFLHTSGRLEVNGPVTITDSFNNHVSRQTNANISPKTTNDYGGFRHDVATGSMTSNKPPIGDGHIMTFFWDNTGRYDSQMAIANNGGANKLTGVAFRGNTNGTWGDWKTLLNMIYPVGSIYMSWNSTSPATLFGGTWERITGGFVYGCVNSSGTGNSTGTSTNASTGSTGASSGSTGGPSTNSTGGVTLTAAQSGLRDHTHVERYGGAPWVDSVGTASAQTGNMTTYSGTTSQKRNQTYESGTANATESHSHTLSSHTHSLNSHTHSLNSHTHGVPYIAVFLWKRTA